MAGSHAALIFNLASFKFSAATYLAFLGAFLSSFLAFFFIP
jgi:hypothetical protein